MKKFAVHIERELTQTLDLEIEAENADEACELAEDEILNIADDGWDDGDLLGDPEITKAVEVSDGADDDESEEAKSEDAEPEDDESEEAADQEAA